MPNMGPGMMMGQPPMMGGPGLPMNMGGMPMAGGMSAGFHTGMPMQNPMGGMPGMPGM